MRASDLIRSFADRIRGYGHAGERQLHIIARRNLSMSSLLAVQVSPRFESSTSRKLTTLFVDEWRTAHP